MAKSSTARNVRASARRDERASSPRIKTTTRTESAAFTTDDAAEAYEHFLSNARAAAASEPGTVYNADLSVLPHNVESALAAVGPHLSRSDVSATQRQHILELPALVLALVHADTRVVEAASPGAIAAAQAVQRPLRQDALSYLEAVAGASVKIVPAERVAKIRQGRGPVDEARDGIAIAGLFKEFADALRNKHPFTAVQLATLESKSVYLLRALAPDNAAPELSAAAPSDESVVRAGFWLLVQHAYDELLLVAAKVWGVRRVYEHVPALLAHARGARADGAAGAPAPAATPGA